MTTPRKSLFPTTHTVKLMGQTFDAGVGVESFYLEESMPLDLEDRDCDLVGEATHLARPRNCSAYGVFRTPRVDGPVTTLRAERGDGTSRPGALV